MSPATPLVQQLFERTIPFMSFGTFIVLFGVFECAIGILFLIPRADRLTLALFTLHMVSTVGPLLLVPEASWVSFLVPTLEGQYIIKNVALIALALAIAARAPTSTHTQ